MFGKFIFFIGWIGIGLLSIGGIGLALFQQNIGIDMLALIKSRVFNFSLFGISFFYILLFIEKTISLFVKEDRGYEFKTETGVVSISENSLNALIKEVVDQNKEVKNVKATSFKGKKGLNVSVKIDIEAIPNLSEKLNSIQVEVKDELIKKLNIEVEKIDIRANKFIFLQMNVLQFLCCLIRLYQKCCLNYPCLKSGDSCFSKHNLRILTYYQDLHALHKLIL